MRLSLPLILTLPLIAALGACGGGDAPDPGSIGNQSKQSGSRSVPGYIVTIERTDTVVTVQVAPESHQPMPISLSAWRGGDEYLDPVSATDFTNQTDGSFTGNIPSGSGAVLWVRLSFADGSQMIAGRDAFTL